jgi:hypothetical protein
LGFFGFDICIDSFGRSWGCLVVCFFFFFLHFSVLSFSNVLTYYALRCFDVHCWMLKSFRKGCDYGVPVQLGVGWDVGGVTGVGMGMASLGGFLGGRILLSPDLWSQLLLSLMTCMKSLNSEILGLGMRRASTWLSALMQMSKQ